MIIRLYMEPEITSDHVDRIKSRLLEVTNTSTSHPSAFIFDFSKTTKVDSTGIGAIKAICENMRIQQRRISLDNVPSDILELMRIMRLDRCVKIVEKS